MDVVDVAASGFRVGLGKLLGRITARGQLPATVWKLCADYHLSSALRQDHMKVPQALMYLELVVVWVVVVVVVVVVLGCAGAAEGSASCKAASWMGQTAAPGEAHV